MLEKYRKWKEDYERRKDLAPTQEAAEGGEVYGPPEKKKKEKEKKKKEEEEEKMRPPETFADPFWHWGLRLPAKEKPGKTVDPTEGIGFDSFVDIDGNRLNRFDYQGKSGLEEGSQEERHRP